MRKDTHVGCLMILFITLLCGALDFLFVAGIYWIVCLCAGLIFKWSLAFLIWVADILLTNFILYFIEAAKRNK